MGVSEDNDIVQYTGGSGYELATAHEIRRHVNLIQQVIKSVFKPDTHYGIIPGCKQKSLYKAGAEKILTTFRIAVDPEIEDLSTPDEIRYRLRVKGITPDGRLVGVGVGECSSNEEKFAWRAAVSDAEFQATDELRRRVKYFKDGRTVNQIRTNPADVANTVLKIGKKRGMIDLCLTATGASDVFTQDIEDMPTEIVESLEAAKPPISPPQRKSATQKQESLVAGGEVVGRVENIETKSGNTGGKDWVFYAVTVAGQTFGTFSDSIVNEANIAKMENAEVRLTWKPGKKQGSKNIEKIELVAGGAVDESSENF
jgi:hypothetical protein